LVFIKTARKIPWKIGKFLKTFYKGKLQVCLKSWLFIKATTKRSIKLNNKKFCNKIEMKRKEFAKQKLC
jgi:hypothetical protein